MHVCNGTCMHVFNICGYASRDGSLTGELEGLDQAQNLIRVAANGEVVDHAAAHDALAVDDKEAAEVDARVAALLWVQAQPSASRLQRAPGR